MKIATPKLKIMRDCYREKKDNTESGSSAITAESQIVSPPQEPRKPCSNCRKLGFKCRTADNEGEKRCQQCIDGDFISCENSRSLRIPQGPVLSPKRRIVLKPPTATIPEASGSGTTSKGDSVVVRSQVI
jgi:hypothetical protein